MKFYQSINASHKRVSYACELTEYTNNFAKMSFAIAEINGKFPDPGYAVNAQVCELAFVQKGSGRLFINGQVISLNKSDVVIIEAGDHYYWQGCLTLMIVCNPCFTASQQKVIPY